MMGLLLRLALQLTPRAFRERYGAELVETHRLRRRAAGQRGGRAVARLAVKELGGLVLLPLRARTELAVGGATGFESRSRFGDDVAQDVRFGVRTLRRNPGYALTAVAVLAIGIGTTTAIFAAVNASFFRPLPFGDADGLVMLYETNPEFGWRDASAAPANMLDWREQVEAFADVAAYSELVGRVPSVVAGEAVVLLTDQVTGNLFSVLGVRPALGQGFEWEDTWESERRGIVISHRAWTRYFSADPGVIGRIIEFGGRDAEIVGVMPERFTFPSDETDVWYTWSWARSARDEVWFRRAHFVRPIARLAPGVTPAEANAQFQAVVQRLQQDYPETNSVMGAGLMPIREFLIRGVRRPLLTLLVAVGLLLLLACANVGNLALVRGSARTRELGLRHALGAGRWRVARQLLTESVIVGVAGGALGLGLGWAGVRAMEALTPLGIAGATAVALDMRVVVFATCAAVLSGLLFGWMPAIRGTGGRLHGILLEGGTGSSATRGSLRTVRVFVAAEVALALLLVAAAGLMMRSFLLLRDVDPGFSTQGTIAVQLTAPPGRYQSRDAVLAFQDRLLAALEARPGIARAGIAGGLPLSGASWSSQLQAEGWPPERVGFEILHRRADAGYFAALGVPLIRGRMFDKSDGPDAPLVVLINETFAREHFPGEDPIGQRIAYDRRAGPESIWYEIVGVVGDQHQVSPGEPARAEAFEHRYQDWARTSWIVLRTNVEPVSAVATVRDVLNEIDPLIPLQRIRPLHEVWRESMAREQFILTLLGVFGVVALLLAAIGVYGVAAQAAAHRTREIGIRMALGAGASSVLLLMLRQSLGAVTIGLLAGLGTALLAGRGLRTLLYGIGPDDPVTLAGVSLLLAGVAAFACYLPVRRAMLHDPLRSLKHD